MEFLKQSVGIPKAIPKQNDEFSQQTLEFLYESIKNITEGLLEAKI